MPFSFIQAIIKIILCFFIGWTGTIEDYCGNATPDPTPPSTTTAPTAVPTPVPQPIAQPVPQPIPQPVPQPIPQPVPQPVPVPSPVSPPSWVVGALGASCLDTCAAGGQVCEVSSMKALNSKTTFNAVFPSSPCPVYVASDAPFAPYAHEGSVACAFVKSEGKDVTCEEKPYAEASRICCCAASGSTCTIPSV